MRVSTAAVALATTLASTVAGRAQAQDYYSLYLTGVQVVEMRTSADDPFVVAYVIEENGRVNYPVFVPGQDRPWENVRVGDVFRMEHRVWHGPTQDIRLQAHVYHYDTSLSNFLAFTTTLGAALVAVGTGGAGGAVIGVVGGAAADKVRDIVGGDSVPLGEAYMTLELDRASGYAARPTNEHLGIYYDFYTEHELNGGLYGLFWEVRGQ